MKSLTNKIMTPEEILNLSLYHFSKLEQEEEEPIFFNEENNSFTYLEGGDFKLIKPDNLKLLMLNIIKTQLKKQKRIFLYICPDDALISFDEIQGNETDEDLDIFEKVADNFYIGYD